MKHITSLLLLFFMMSVAAMDSVFETEPESKKAKHKETSIVEKRMKAQLYQELIDAAHAGDVEKCESLLDSGAKINKRRHAHDTPLHTATKEGRWKVCALLISRKAELNLKNQDRMAPLHLAAQAGNLRITQMLLDAGADTEVSSDDTKKCTPLLYAAGYLEQNTNGNLIHFPVIRALIDKGADVINPSTPYGETLFHLIAWYGSFADRALTEKLCLELIDRGCDPNRGCDFENRNSLDELLDQWDSNTALGKRILCLAIIVPRHFYYIAAPGKKDPREILKEQNRRFLTLFHCFKKRAYPANICNTILMSMHNWLTKFTICLLFSMTMIIKMKHRIA